MNIDTNIFDAIVIGSGISGGWAAKELCEKGLKTLLLERGRNVEHIKDYPTATLKPWELPPEHDDVFFVNEDEYPYIQEQSFTWARGYQVGGRSLIWGRQCYRLSDLDFSSNSRNGVGVDWPIRYKDIAPWYSYVENYIGISGQAEQLEHLPDGEFLPPMELNCIEKHLAQSIKRNDSDRLLTIARVANLTKGWNNRGPCMNRNLCIRGCPYGGYFSSNSSTIPAALYTGNLTLRPFSIVTEIIYDDNAQRAKGVRIIDAITKENFEYFAKIIFLNASTIASAAILLNSTSGRFPNGLGNDSGQVGHNLMDHHSSAGAYGVHEGYKDFYYKGRRPCGFTIPRFRNVENRNQKDFIGGYMIHGRGERREWEDQLLYLKGFGSEFKRNLTTPGPWTVWMAGWGECLPYYDNRVVLNHSKKDSWGMPLVSINFSFKENEHNMMKDTMSTSAKMLSEAGFKDIEAFNYHKPGGATAHEMGTIRMGNDPKTSVLNKFNQIHSVKNVFITDGSCMTSSACQSPSLTYMALTARACDYAVKELRNGTL
jgi:choline dehydrogenase-like flavoprotein